VRTLKERNGDDILPVIFSDNYISLAPAKAGPLSAVMKINMRSIQSHSF
jgi:hypothetical protein